MAVELSRALLTAVALAATMSASPEWAPNGLVTAMISDERISACANEASKSVPAYVKQAFQFRDVRLRGGEQMTVAVATDGCMFLGQSSRIMIFEHTSRGFQRVLDNVTLPDFDRVNTDGTVVLPTHETMETIFEASYVWNGKTYEFSESQSHIYDVPLRERRPYEVAVHFTPGTSSTTLVGSSARNFGQRYVVRARAGQEMTIELVKRTGPRPAIVLSYGDDNLVEVDSDRWSGKVPRTGVCYLTVLGSGEPDATLVSTYWMLVAIH